MNLAILSDKQTAVTPFSFDDFAIRALTIDGEPWFVAADVCAALELGNVSQALARLDDEEKGVISNEGIHAGPGNPTFNVINESGLYSLILGSRKPEAKRFKRWVTSEVLPSIRKTGSYSVQAPAFALPDFANPASAARAWAVQYEATQTLTVERDHAIATKAQINNKITATAMATASHLKRENNKLKDELGFNTHHATVIAVEGASGKKFGKQDWRPLKAWCKANGAASVTVPCARYGKAQAWPSGAWGAVYGVDLVELFGEVAA